jgi:hypothetical protein
LGHAGFFDQQIVPVIPDANAVVMDGDARNLRKSTGFRPAPWIVRVDFITQQTPVGAAISTGSTGLPVVPPSVTKQTIE